MLSVAYSNAAHALINGMCTFFIFSNTNRYKKYSAHLILFKRSMNGLCPTRTCWFPLFITISIDQRNEKKMRARFPNAIFTICLKQLLSVVDSFASRNFRQNAILTFTIAIAISRCCFDLAVDVHFGAKPFYRSIYIWIVGLFNVSA